MPSIQDLGKVTENPELLAIFKTAIRRAAWNIIAASNPPAPALEWAKKCRTVFDDDRSQFYAQLTIEGLIATSSDFRALVDQNISSPGSIQVADATLSAFVDQAVTIFVTRNI